MRLLLSKQKTFVSFLLLLFSITVSIAQDIIPPSPEASSLLKYANIPAVEYTGATKIDLPLLELQGRRLNIPVSISYHTSGIKVQDIAGSVGLGWTLNAGGVITRTVRGIPDEAPEGYCGPNRRGKEINQDDISYYSDPMLHRIATEAQDGEPDVFYFNFQGRTGRFVLDGDGNPVLIPYQNIKIKPGIGPNGGGGSWEITTEDGTVYVFGLGSDATEETEYTSKRFDGSEKTESYISSWYLSKIKTPNLEETVSFTYQIGQNLEYTYYQSVESRQTRTFDCGDGLTTELKDLDKAIVVKQPKYLEKIENVKGSVRFYYNINRNDLDNGLALSDVLLEDKDAKIIKKIKLTYSYFYNDRSYRLRLDIINEETAFDALTLYSFKYNTTDLLPARDSPNYDFWGYFNNNNSDSHIPYVNSYYDGVYYDGASRQPDPIKAKANSLNAIIYSTGGFTKLTYEGHTYLDEQNNEKNAAGIRVSQVDQYEADGNLSLSKKYHYTPRIEGTADVRFYNHSISYIDGNCRKAVLLRNSLSFNQLFDLNGIHVYYNEVEEQHADGSKIQRMYTDYSDNETEVYLKRRYYVPPGFPFFEYTLLNNAFPFPPPTYEGWKRGQLKEITHKNNEDNTVKKELYKYDFDTPIISKIRGLSVYEMYYDDKINKDYPYCHFQYGQYEVISQPFFLTSKTEELYDPEDESKKVVTKTAYQYNPDFLQVNQENVTDSEGTEWKTQYTYITDFYDVLKESLNEAENSANWHSDNSKETRALLGLLASHQHTQVLETIVSRKSATDARYKVVNGKLMLYQWPGSEPLRAQPSQTLSLSLSQPVTDFINLSVTKSGEDLYTVSYDNRYEVTQTWDKHDDYSNVLQQKSSDGIISSFIWGYENTLPIAKVTGADKDQAFYTSFEDNYYSNWYVDGEGSVSVSNFGKTGSRSFYGDNNSIGRENLPRGLYILSFWAHNNTTTTIRGNTTVLSEYNDETSTNGWKYFEKKVRVTVTGNTLLLNVTGNIDELRLYPATAQMTTYTYDPLIGMTSKTDTNSIITYYEYDEFGRVKAVKDHHLDLREVYQYQYKTSE